MKIGTSLIALCAVAAGSALSAPVASAKDPSARVKRGDYLVKTSGCNDCHTPFQMGPNGPEPDMTRMLSGHPEKLVLPPAPRLAPGPWMGTVAATFTAWAGPFGTSYTANLTPDKETGLGKWTERMFIDTIRTGRHQGRGRPLLPPMPWPAYRNFTDEDLQVDLRLLADHPGHQEPRPRSGGARGRGRPALT